MLDEQEVHLHAIIPSLQSREGCIMTVRHFRVGFTLASETKETPKTLDYIDWETFLA